MAITKTKINPIHEEILRVLTVKDASYATPISSEEIGSVLNVTPSYVREQAMVLRRMDLIGVRRGRGGGYYIHRWRGQGGRSLKR